MNLVCLKHPTYNGDKAPILSCNSCCKIFVANLTKDTPMFNAAEWLNNKTQNYSGLRRKK